MNNNGLEIISCSKLDKQFIDEININKYSNSGKKLIFQVENTKCIDKNVLKYLESLTEKNNINIMIRLAGLYDINFEFNDTKNGRKSLSTLYALGELYQIITNFEEIESIIEPHWNQFDIAIYLIDTIVRRVMYDPEYVFLKKNNVNSPKILGNYDQADFLDRSLRGILTGKTICAGYSVIFKELANRNGIKCEYVSGLSYSSSGIKLGGHAWNILNINGVSYPLDITKINAKYRKGDFSYIEVLSYDVEKFKMCNRPYDEKYNVGLTEMDIEAILKTRRKTSRIKNHNSTTYVRKRKDNSRFILSQVGMYKGLYKYLYSEINPDGSYSDINIFFSESSFFGEKNNDDYGRSDSYNEFIENFDNILFSKENLNDSLITKRTNYIGRVKLTEKEEFVKKSLKAEKSDRSIYMGRISNKISRRLPDGSMVILIGLKSLVNKDRPYLYYHYLLSEGPSVIEHNFYSNVDYFSTSRLSELNYILNYSYVNTSCEHIGIKR